MQSKSLMLLLAVMLLLPACGLLKPTPVAVECPLPPKLPQEVVKSVSTRQPLVPQLNAIEDEFAASLKRAMKPILTPKP